MRKKTKPPVIRTIRLGDDDEELLTSDELAKELGRSTQWVHNGRYQNYGPPYIKMGRQIVLYRRGDVRAWLRSCTKATYRPKCVEMEDA